MQCGPESSGLCPRWAEAEEEEMVYLKNMLNSEYLWEQETDHVRYILEPYSALRGQLFLHQNIFPVSFGEVRRNTLMLSHIADEFNLHYTCWSVDWVAKKTFTQSIPSIF